MKYWEAKSNLPFGIKKGDFLTEEKGKLKNEKGEVIPLKPSDEPDFFKETVLAKSPFEEGALVALAKPLSAREFESRKWFELPAWTPFKVVASIKNKFKVAVLDFNGKLYEVELDKIFSYKEYFFINSSGEVHKAVETKDEYADTFRKKTKNYYETKEDAQKVLFKFMGEPKKSPVKKATTKKRSSIKV